MATDIHISNIGPLAEKVNRFINTSPFTIFGHFSNANVTLMTQRLLHDLPHLKKSAYNEDETSLFFYEVDDGFWAWAPLIHGEESGGFIFIGIPKGIETFAALAHTATEIIDWVRANCDEFDLIDRGRVESIFTAHLASQCIAIPASTMIQSL